MPISVEGGFCSSLSLTNLSNRAGFSEVHCPSTQFGQCAHRSSAPLTSVIGVMSFDKGHVLDEFFAVAAADEGLETEEMVGAEMQL